MWRLSRAESQAAKKLLEFGAPTFKGISDGEIPSALVPRGGLLDGSGRVCGPSKGKGPSVDCIYTENDGKCAAHGALLILNGFWFMSLQCLERDGITV